MLQRHLADPWGIIECMMVDLVAGEPGRVHERIAARFGRAEPRARVRQYVSGLVAGPGAEERVDAG
jgi:hypothetical protein